MVCMSEQVAGTPAAAGDHRIDRDVAAARAAYDSGATRPLSWRLDRLRAMNRMLVERRGEFASALAADLGKHPSEALLTELGFLIGEIAHTVRHLPCWLEPRRATVPLSLRPGTASVVLEPLGVVLVIAPWNYPIHLVLAPVIGALAAGNTVVAKPSELAPNSSAALARWVPEYLPGAVWIVEGGEPEAAALLEQRFDHIFYTGNARVGRIVMAAAARHLTPVTLELGGKSPVYLDGTVDMRAAAARIAWGKFMNAGQSCVAPDYVLGTGEALEKLAAELPAAIRSLYGDEPQHSLAYGRMVSDTAFGRVAGMLATDLAAARPIRRAPWSSAGAPTHPPAHRPDRGACRGWIRADAGGDLRTRAASGDRPVRGGRHRLHQCRREAAVLTSLARTPAFGGRSPNKRPRAPSALA